MSVGKETWGKLSPLLDELLDLPDGERDARLAALRAQDPVLAEAVATMLQHLPAIERGEFMPASAAWAPSGWRAAPTAATRAKSRSSSCAPACSGMATRCASSAKAASSRG